MTARISLTAVLVTLLAACDTGGDASQRGSEHIQAAAGGTVIGDGARLEVPPGALPADLSLQLRVEEVQLLHDGIYVRAVHVEPEGLTFSRPATLTLDAVWLGLRAVDTYEAASAYGALAVTVTESALTIQLSSTGKLTVTRGPCETACDDGRTCHGGRCLSTCTTDEDCSDHTRCGNGFEDSVHINRRCDEAASVCVIADVTVTRCDRACMYETGLCAEPDECAPPQRPWPGATGRCLCGFPELTCTAWSSIPGTDPPPNAGVGAACSTSADCEGNGCGLPLCLRPGQMYPDECYINGLLSCFYVAEAFGEACSSMCVP